jgi:hypothetical protein
MILIKVTPPDLGGVSGCLESIKAINEHIRTPDFALKLFKTADDLFLGIIRPNFEIIPAIFKQF